MIRNYGGVEKLQQLDNTAQQWNIVALIRNQTGVEIRKSRAPDKLRVELSFSGKTETRILNDEGLFVLVGDGEAQQVTGTQYDTLRYQKMRLYSPLMLRTRIDSISLSGQGNQYALSIVEQGLRVSYLVNKDNWRIEKVSGTLMADGVEIKFLTIYSDFSYIDGLLVHRKEDEYAGGMNTASLQLQDITFNAELEDSLFQP